MDSCAGRETMGRHHMCLISGSGLRAGRLRADLGEESRFREQEGDDDLRPELFENLKTDGVDSMVHGGRKVSIAWSDARFREASCRGWRYELNGRTSLNLHRLCK